MNFDDEIRGDIILKMEPQVIYDHLSYIDKSMYSREKSVIFVHSRDREDLVEK